MTNKYEQGKYYEFKFDSHFEYNKVKDIEWALSTTRKDGHSTVIIIGDRFMRGIFVSADAVKKSYEGWNRTLHDINHMGSGYAAGFSVIPPDIEYIVGWQDGLSYDDVTKEVKANLHIREGSPKYETWKNYVEICASINRSPNVSVFMFAKVEYKQAKELPMGSGYRLAGYTANDLVPCMVDIRPFMVSTVTMGSCNDKDGCGIGNAEKTDDTDTCNDGTCNVTVNIDKEGKNVEEIDRLEEEKSKQKIKYFKDRIKSLKGE